MGLHGLDRSLRIAVAGVGVRVAGRLPEHGGRLPIDVAINLFARNIAEQEDAEVREIDRSFAPHDTSVEAFKRRIGHKIRPKPLEILDDEFLLHQPSPITIRMSANPMRLEVDSLVPSVVVITYNAFS